MEPVVTPAPEKTEAEGFEPYPLAVALSRIDDFQGKSVSQAGIHSGDTKKMGDALVRMIRSEGALFKHVSEDEIFHQIVVYGAVPNDTGMLYSALVITGHNAEISLKVSDLSLSGLLQKVSRELERCWLSLNLNRIRPPLGTAMQLEVKIVNAEVLSEHSLRGQILVSQKRSRFELGEEVAIQIRPSHDGYLTILNVDSKGGIHQLYPYPGDTRSDAGFVKGGQLLELPEAPYSFPIERPLGSEMLKAFLTPKPLTGLREMLVTADQDSSPERPIAAFRGVMDNLERRIQEDLAPAEESVSAGSGLDWSVFDAEDWAEASVLFTTSE